jgi:hypothetical protein
MLRHCFPLALFLLFALSVKAQNEKKYIKPDYTAIERSAKDKALKTYYPRLFDRYQHNDTTLSDNDFRILYYGYYFQAKPHPKSNVAAYEDSIKLLEHKEELTADEMKKMVRFTKEDLEYSPYDIENLHRLCNFYQMLDVNDSVGLYLYKMKMIARTVFSTGDGASAQSAIHVISVNDEYSVLHLLGYEFNGQTHLANNYDFLSVKKNMDGITGLYFDITHVYAQKHSEIQKRK